MARQIYELTLRQGDDVMSNPKVIARNFQHAVHRGFSIALRETDRMKKQFTKDGERFIAKRDAVYLDGCEFSGYVE